MKEYPRWLAFVGRSDKILCNLAYLRRELTDSGSEGCDELLEIESRIDGRGARVRVLDSKRPSCASASPPSSKTWSSASYGPFSYRGPQISPLTENSLLASGIYGVVK
ncbi:hypothetical protein H0H93_009885, partial [Arthromyces matolae]